ncbi:hypothetical protein NX059_002987 [Plenodomus lindquistii]|nr:hypothetical protein NX059_002987 [Plenodomus lindquistii]
MSRSKNLVRDWDDGRTQSGVQGDMPDKPENLGVQIDKKDEDQKFTVPESRPEVHFDKRKKPITKTETNMGKAEKDMRGDSAWKSRQGSLPEPQKSPENYEE